MSSSSEWILVFSAVVPVTKTRVVYNPKNGNGKPIAILVSLLAIDGAKRLRYAVKDEAAIRICRGCYACIVSRSILRHRPQGDKGWHERLLVGHDRGFSTGVFNGDVGNVLKNFMV
ncbi:MAG: hypothetical protein K9K75_03140 [Deltaproteobacteria bacterium]|nr:hypothetical protein [Deltaproteobacteria bacterium]